jgi:CelD/BcsL family acetyltransferase involved in cellulose biosynthesis
MHDDTINDSLSAIPERDNFADQRGTIPVFEISLEPAYDFLSDEYAALFAGSRATAFQHPLWLDRIYRALAPQVNAEPVVVTVRWRHNGRLAMLLPLLRRRHGILRVIEFADLQVSDYAAPVSDEQAVGRIAGDGQVREKIRALLKPYDLIRIQKLSEEGLPLEQLLGISRRSAMAMSAHAVSLQGPYAQWEQQNIGSSYRKELEKKRRQLGRKGAVRFACAQDSDEIARTFEAMRRYRRERFDGGDLLQQPLYFDFYLDIARNGKGSGLSRTYTLWLDQEPIGGVWGLYHQNRFLVLLCGFDLASHKNQSIGALTFADVAHDCIERQDRVLDFTIGDESYKRLFGACPSTLWAISAPGTPLGRLASLVADHVPWAVKVAKEVLHKRRDDTPAQVKEA